MRKYRIPKYKQELWGNHAFGKYSEGAIHSKSTIKHICPNRIQEKPLKPKQFKLWYHETHGPLLYIARFNPHPWIAKFFAQHALDKFPEIINYVDNYGFTALHWAVYTRNRSVLKLLLRFKPNIYQEDQLGHNAIIASYVSSFEWAIRMFFRKHPYTFKLYYKKQGMLYHLPKLFELKKEYIEKREIDVRLGELYKSNLALVERIKNIYKRASLSIKAV